MKIGYWGIRGKGELVRYLATYLGVEFEDKTYSGLEEWQKEKEEFKNSGKFLPNLPYLLDGDFHLSESVAIARYLVEKYGKSELLGKDVQSRALVSAIYSAVDDINVYQVKSLNESYKEKFAEFEPKILYKLEQLNSKIGEKDTLLDYLTLADFYTAIVYKRQKQYMTLLKTDDKLKNFKGLEKLTQKIYGLP